MTTFQVTLCTAGRAAMRSPLAKKTQSSSAITAWDTQRAAGQDVVWLEAEAFDTTGGWSNDSQHVDIMGSPYLLATGTGYPVADAAGEVEIKKPGTYRLWVRCRDWFPS